MTCEHCGKKLADDEMHTCDGCDGVFCEKCLDPATHGCGSVLHFDE